VIRGLSAFVLLLVVAACGGASLPPPQASQAPVTQPSLEALSAGTYTSVSFQPPVTFTVPEGWVLPTDTAPYFTLRPLDNDLIGMHLFRDPKAASQDATCPAAPEPGVGGSAAELAAWIQGRPGLVVSTPTMATVGGLTGLSMDVGLKADWKQSCPFANGLPSVPLFNSSGIDHWVVVGNERLRLFLLDLPGGGTVAVDLDAFDGDQIEDLLSRSSGVLRSLQFASASSPASSPGTAPASSPGTAPASSPTLPPLPTP
jgi:hypothetical protein